MTHHTAKANLEKGSSWPPEAIRYGLWHIRGLVLTRPINPTLDPTPDLPFPISQVTIRLLIKDSHDPPKARLVKVACTRVVTIITLKREALLAVCAFLLVKVLIVGCGIVSIIGIE